MFFEKINYFQISIIFLIAIMCFVHLTCLHVTIKNRNNDFEILTKYETILKFKFLTFTSFEMHIKQWNNCIDVKYYVCIYCILCKNANI